MSPVLTIIVDSRERRPLAFPLDVQVETATLGEGDYAAKGFERFARIERKSGADLWGTVHGGHERFNRELSRLGEIARVALVVDDAWSVADIAARFGASAKDRLRLEAIVMALEWKARIPVRFEGTRDGAALYILRALRSTIADFDPAILARCEETSRLAGPYGSPGEIRKAALASLFGLCVVCARRPGRRPKPAGPGVCACGRKTPT